MPIVTSIFGASHVGTIVAAPQSQVASFSLIGTEPRLPTVKAIVAGLSWKDGVNVQFTHTMGDEIYMNVFGNRMGTLTIEGVTFAAEGKSKKCVGNIHGIQGVIDWYKENRVSANDTAIVVTVGGKEPISGYLVGASYQAKDPQNWTINYRLDIATVPRS
jgi:hypothetical protein